MIERMGLALRRDGDAPADLYLDEDGNLAIVRNAQAVGQHVRQRLMTFHGEWFLDTTVGIRWLRDVLGGNYDPVMAESLVKAEVLATDGVIDISGFSVRFSRVTRGLSAADITVVTEYEEEISV